MNNYKILILDITFINELLDSNNRDIINKLNKYYNYRNSNWYIKVNYEKISIYKYLFEIINISNINEITNILKHIKFLNIKVDSNELPYIDWYKLYLETLKGKKQSIRKKYLEKMDIIFNLMNKEKNRNIFKLPEHNSSTKNIRTIINYIVNIDKECTMNENNYYDYRYIDNILS